MIKTGDKKQATILGVFAVFAIGMLGKTALGAFGGGGSNRPIQVKDLGGPGTVARPEKSEGATPNTTPEPGQSAGVNAPPAKEPPATITRDAFSKPDMPLKTKPFAPRGMAGNLGGESMTENPANPLGRNYNIGDGDENANRGKALPAADKAGTDESGKGEAAKKGSEIKAPPKKVVPTIRFNGYVEAGSPMGIISIDGTTMSVQIGEILECGFKIVAITNDHIVIRSGKVTKTISIGKETQF